MDDKIDRLVRDNIRRLQPYSSARAEFSGEARIFLDANENACGSPVEDSLNRYPDPYQTAVREQVARLHGVENSQVFVGNGSDEAIDLLLRVFCRPAEDSIIVCPPTYGMYEVSAAINDVSVHTAPLREDFSLDLETVERAADPTTKIIFLCSPNNPTGNLLDPEEVATLLRIFPGIVVLDEAYIEFAGADSFVSRIDEFENLVVVRTFSKAWGLAGARVGLAIANERIIQYLLRVKPPYNVSTTSQANALKALDRIAEVRMTIEQIIEQRELLSSRLPTYGFVRSVHPSAANFLLVQVEDAEGLYRFLLSEHIVVRDRSRVPGCAGCLRITIGTEKENRRLLEALDAYEKSFVYRP